MPLTKTQPNTIKMLFAEFVEGADRLVELKAVEGAAGNVSCCFLEMAGIFEVFSQKETVELPVVVPGLEGWLVLVTGSAERMRDLRRQPEAGLGVLKINPGGRLAKLYTHPQRRFNRLSSELNSHLAAHEDQVLKKEVTFHGLVHAQPPYLTFLSHLPKYHSEHELNSALMRWQPETIVNFPQGLGMIPYSLPGSEELMRANVDKLQLHSLVIWSKHGVLARGKGSLLSALDLIEYAEAAARYEMFHLITGTTDAGLTREEIIGIGHAFGVSQNIF